MEKNIKILNQWDINTRECKHIDIVCLYIILVLPLARSYFKRLQYSQAINLSESFEFSHQSRTRSTRVDLQADIRQIQT